MPKTAVVTARVDPDLKLNAELVLTELGLSTSQAITLFLKQVDLQRGLPFSVKMPAPNETTRQALADAENRRDLTSFDTTNELFEDLGV